MHVAVLRESYARRVRQREPMDRIESGDARASGASFGLPTFPFPKC